MLGWTGLLRQTPLGQTGLLGTTLLWLWQTSLERIDLLEPIFLGQTGLLRQKLLEIIGLLGQTLLKHTDLLGQISLLG